MISQRQSEPRERILEAADRLFYTEGVRATGTEKIMSVSKVAKATFYRYPVEGVVKIRVLGCDPKERASDDVDAIDYAFDPG